MSDARCDSRDDPITMDRSLSAVFLARIIDIKCAYTFENTKSWKIDRYSDEFVENGSVPITDLVSNLTALRIPANYLNYSLYKLTFTVTLNRDETRLMTYVNKTSCWLRIRESNIVVQMVLGGINKITRGVSQEICLDPKKFSYDPDVKDRTEDQVSCVGLVKSLYNVSLNKSACLECCCSCALEMICC